MLDSLGNVPTEDQRTMDAKGAKADTAASQESPEMTSMDLARLTPHALSKKDAGELAKEKLQSRSQKIKRALVRTYISVSFLIIALVAAAGYMVYTEYKKPGVLTSYYRTCSYTNEQAKIEITGKREYFYSDKNIFGFHLREKAALDDRTEIDVRGEAMNVVGMSDGGAWWSKFSETGERGIMMLKPADVYIVSMKKVGFPVHYAEFCK